MSSRIAVEGLSRSLGRSIADTSEIGKLLMPFHKGSVFGMTVRLHIQLLRNPPELNTDPLLLQYFHLPEKTLPKVLIPDWFSGG